MLRMQFRKILILLLFITRATGLFSQEKQLLFKNKEYQFLYTINHPDTTWKLPHKLTEISGLSYISKYRLACNHDEKGSIYIFNLLTGDIERKIDFAKDNDYEGVEIVKNNAWVLKSNGILYKVKNYLNENKGDVEKYPTILTKKNDTEGLCYDPSTKHLLIACKGHPFVNGKKGKNIKAIYRFDVKAKLLDMDPYLLIDLKFIKKLKKYNTMSKWGVELLANLDDSKGDITFQPSGIAINPLTKNIYILAAVGNLLMVYSPQKELQAIINLDTKNHPHPEGICFSPEGILYISNEGKGKKGRITAFYFDKQNIIHESRKANK